MKNLKLFTRSVTLVATMSLVIGSGWMLPTGRSGLARARWYACQRLIAAVISIAAPMSIETPILTATPISTGTPT